MPKWIEDRKSYIMKKNPGMDESTAWAVATQQGYAAKKAPKGYGTAKGKKKAKKKYKKPASQYEKKAKPKKKKSDFLTSLISLANELDTAGHYKFADHVTHVLEIALKR